MTGHAIHGQIIKNNELIEQLLNPNQFTLNNQVKELLEENSKLQKQCPHNFIDGYCEFCYLNEEAGI